MISWGGLHVNTIKNKKQSTIMIKLSHPVQYVRIPCQRESVQISLCCFGLKHPINVHSSRLNSRIRLTTYYTSSELTSFMSILMYELGNYSNNSLNKGTLPSSSLLYTYSSFEKCTFTFCLDLGISLHKKNVLKLDIIHINFFIREPRKISIMCNNNLLILCHMHVQLKNMHIVFKLT